MVYPENIMDRIEKKKGGSLIQSSMQSSPTGVITNPISR
jgi:hypothetical protein